MANSGSNEVVGRRIREARFLLGDRTQAEFGQEIGGFSAGQIGQVERGRNLPTGELFAALAKRGINVNYILTGNGSAWISKEAERQREVTPREIEEVIEILRYVQDGLSRNPPLPQDVLEKLRKNKGGKS